MERTLEIPNQYFIEQSPEDFARLLKINTAVDLYKNGKISAGAATELVGDLDRREFLYVCKQRGVDPQTYESIDELKAEVEELHRILK